MEHGKFETWLGSIIKPGEPFYLAGESNEQNQRMIIRAAAIGYETAIAETIIVKGGDVKEAELDIDVFKKHPSDYTIVDVRNVSEVNEGKIFSNSISIPLAELRDRVNEIPIDKPIVVHCAGGYRSAAASSLIHANLYGKVNVFDLGEAIKQFQPGH
jgi:rhodanese-related sulfurtransferase